MADVSGIKNLWIRSMEKIGNTATNIANNTKIKVDEMNLVNRRAEILKEFGNKAYALWQKGEKFPEELEKELRELSGVDGQLNDLRAQRLAGVQTEETDCEKIQMSEDQAQDEAGAPEIEIQAEEIEEKTGELSSAINDLFEKSGDHLNEGIKEMSEEFDRTMDE